MSLSCAVLALGSAKASVEPLAARAPAATAGEAAPIHGSGFFVNRNGDILTARHVTSDCSRFAVQKQHALVPARLVTLSETDDLAILHTDEETADAAVIDVDEPVTGGQPIFAAGYELVSHMEGAPLFNGMINLTGHGPTHDHFTMTLSAEPGTSGSPVLNANGLVIGLITSRTRFASGAAAAGNQSVVIAASPQSITRFLTEAGVAFVRDARPPSGVDGRAAEAARVMVGIVCYR